MCIASRSVQTAANRLLLRFEHGDIVFDAQQHATAAALRNYLRATIAVERCRGWTSEPVSDRSGKLRKSLLRWRRQQAAIRAADVSHARMDDRRACKAVCFGILEQKQGR